MQKKTFTGLILVSAPLVYLAGQSLLAWRTAQGPEITWFLSHALLFAGAVLFVPAMAGMAQVPGRRARLLAGLGGALGIFGALALAGQFAIDLVVGGLTTSQADMSAAIQRLQALPGMKLVFYTLAPVCFFIGWLALVVILAFTGSIPRWTGLAAVAGFVGIGLAVATNQVTVFLLGFAGLALGPVRAGWQRLGGFSMKNNPYIQEFEK